MGKNVIETIPIQKKHMNDVIDLLQSISDYKIDSNDKSIAEIHSELLDVLHKYV